VTKTKQKKREKLTSMDPMLLRKKNGKERKRKVNPCTNETTYLTLERELQRKKRKLITLHPTPYKVKTFT